MRILPRICRRLVPVIVVACLLSMIVLAHTGSGRAIDRNDQVYYLEQSPQPKSSPSPLPSASAPTQTRLDGIWVGIIEVQGLKLRLILRITQDSGGGLTAKLDVPDQGASDLPIDSISFQEKTLRFEAKNLGLSYEGSWSDATKEIV